MPRTNPPIKDRCTQSLGLPASDVNRVPTTEEPLSYRSGLGRWGEAYAATYAETLGMRVIERNWRCAEGEIDIVALDRGCVVFIEVKTRRDHQRGTPLESITPAKLARLRRLAGMWLRQHAHAGVSSRIDAIAITRPGTGVTTVQHIRGLQ